MYYVVCTLCNMEAVGIVQLPPHEARLNMVSAARLEAPHCIDHACSKGIDKIYFVSESCRHKLSLCCS